MSHNPKKQRNEAKKFLRILILGSYDGRAVTRLENLKRRLIDEGYPSTKLVSDFPNDHVELRKKGADVYYTEKSWKFILNWSDLNIFIYFNDFDNEGVTSEFIVYCTDMGCTAAGYLIHESGKRLSTQVKGPAIRKGAPIASFANDNELFFQSRAACIDQVDKLYHFLLNR